MSQQETDKAFVGGYMSTNLKKMLDDRARLHHSTVTEEIKRALEATSVGNYVPSKVYEILPVALQDKNTSVSATVQTATTGIQGTTYAPDRRVREAQARLTRPSLEHLVWLYENEVSLQAVTNLITQTIVGAGWQVDCEDNEVAKKIIEQFNDKINLAWFIETVIENLIIFGNAIFMPIFDEKTNDVKELSLCDYASILVYKHPIERWLKYMQVTKVPTDLPKNEKDFQKNFDVTETHPTSEVIKTTLDPALVIHLKVRARGLEVGTSLIASVVTLGVYKKLLEYFMLQASEVYGAPRVMAFVGNPETPPTTQEETTAITNCMQSTLDALVAYRNMGAMVLPPGVREVQVYSPGTGIINYDVILSYCKRELMLSCLASTSLFEAKGTELATSRTISTIWHEALDSWRRTLKDALERTIYPIVLKYKGMPNVKATIKFNDQEQWTAQEAVSLYNAGLLGLSEIREEYGYDPELPEEEQKQKAPNPFGDGSMFPPAEGNPPKTVPPQPLSDELMKLKLDDTRRGDPAYEERIRQIEEATAHKARLIMQEGVNKLKKKEGQT